MEKKILEPEAKVKNGFIGGIKAHVFLSPRIGLALGFWFLRFCLILDTASMAASWEMN